MLHARITTFAIFIVLLSAGTVHAGDKRTCSGAGLDDAYDCLRSRKLGDAGRRQLIARLSSLTGKQRNQAIELLGDYVFVAPARVRPHVLRALVRLGHLTSASARRVPTGATLVRRIRSALLYRRGDSKGMSHAHMRCYGIPGKKGAIRCHRRELARIRAGHCSLERTRKGALIIGCSTTWCGPCIDLGIKVHVVVPANPKRRWSVRGYDIGGPTKGGCGHGCFDHFR